MATTTLVADPLAFALAYEGAGNDIYASPLGFAVGFPEVRMQRGYVVDLGTLTLRLDRLPRLEHVVDSRGNTSRFFQHQWQRHCESIEEAFGKLVLAVTQIQATYDAAAQAQVAATEASNSAAQATEQIAEVEQAVDDLQTGALSLDAITIGGTVFVNDGGNLVPNIP